MDGRSLRQRQSQPLRVLFLPSWYPSAVDPVLGTFVLEHAKAAALHQDVCVIYPYEVEPHAGLGTQMTSNGLRTIRQPYALPAWRRLFAVYYLFAFHRATKSLPPKWRPDVMHLHVGYPAGLAAAYGLLRWRSPLVYTEQAGPLDEKILATRVSRWCLPRVARRARLGAPVSRFLAEDMARSGLLPSRFEILPNAVDTKVFGRQPGQSCDDGRIKMLAAALLVPAKGLEYAIDAVALLRQQGHPAVLSIAGDGPLRDALEARAASRSVRDQVTFTGMLTKRELAAVMHRHDVFVMPSDRETFSAVIVEAMAAGLPVVATRSGGPDDLVTADTGILVETRSPQALADAVLEIQAEPERFNRGPARVRENYSVEAVAYRLREMYRTVLQ